MITERTQRKLVQRIAMSYLGTFYTWGGDDPSGFDCSGLVIECLKSIGVLPRSGDWTANTLSKKFVSVIEPKPGDLACETVRRHSAVCGVSTRVHDRDEKGRVAGAQVVRH